VPNHKRERGDVMSFHYRLFSREFARLKVIANHSRRRRRSFEPFRACPSNRASAAAGDDPAATDGAGTGEAQPTVFTKSVEAQTVAAGIAGAGFGAGRESAIAASAKLVGR
jgi:hypothetical protein